MTSPRLLSMHRRTGPQLPLQIAEGRSQRHQRNASELVPEDFGLIRGVLFAAIPSLALWAALIGIAAWFVDLLARAL
jgi:hypothetical protein